jgi:hypothetical protein
MKTIKKMLAGTIFTIVSFVTIYNSYASPIIINGSFESPTVAYTNGYDYGTPSVWEWGWGPGIIFNGTYLYWPSPQDGQQYVDIGNNSIYNMLKQSFTVTATGAYTLQWFDNTYYDGNPGGNVPNSPYTVSITDNSSNVLFSITSDAYHNGIWQKREEYINLQSGLYNIVFTSMATSSRYYDTLIDNVSLANSAVPEPSTYILLTIALGAVGYARKKMNKQA